MELIHNFELRNFERGITNHIKRTTHEEATEEEDFDTKEALKD